MSNLVTIINDQAVTIENLKRDLDMYRAAYDREKLSAIEWAGKHQEATEKIEELKSELEVERMRLAACGTAALGYFDDCSDEYKSASLSDVLRLYERYEDLKRDSEYLNFLDSLKDRYESLRKVKHGLTSDIHLSNGHVMICVRDICGRAKVSRGGYSIREAISNTMDKYREIYGNQK